MKTINFSFSALLIIGLCFSNIFSYTVFEDDFETDKGWNVDPYNDDNATTGMWERANPQATSSSGVSYQLNTPPNGGSNNLVTGALAGQTIGTHDIDNGKTSILSPQISLPSSGTITVSFYYYLAHTSNSSSSDYLIVRIVGSTTQTIFEERGASNTDGGVWEVVNADVSDFAGQTVTFLIEAADNGNGSIVEAGIDDFLVEATTGGQQYTLTTQVGTGSGSVEPISGSTYDAGTTVACSAIPDEGYIFVSWGGALNGSTNPNEEIIMDGDKTIIANFVVGTSSWQAHNDGVYLDPLDKNVGIGTTPDGIAGLKIEKPLLEPAIRLTDDNANSELILNSMGIFGTDLFIQGSQITAANINAYSEVVAGTDLLAGGDLKVEGIAYAREVIVTSDPFPDYVFAKDYKLKSLEQIQEYINENGHLPGIPTAKEVKENGLNMGSMQVKLLEKIEEMTLHLISLEEKNNALKEEVNELKKQVNNK